MVLSTREELHLLIDKLPESKVEKILETLKQDNTFNYTIQEDDITLILKEDAELLKKLAQ